jgi:Tfp pilus assembly PilM family ATPase
MPAADDARSSGETATAVAQRTALAALVDELELCRRYYEATFPNLPIERIVFVGGGASQRNWCQYIARSLNIAAVVGDPLQRLTRTPGVERVGDLDLRQAAPAWTAAIGLSLRCQEDKNKAKA